MEKICIECRAGITFSPQCKISSGIGQDFLGNPDQYLYFGQDFGKYWSGFYTKVRTDRVVHLRVPDLGGALTFLVRLQHTGIPVTRAMWTRFDAENGVEISDTIVYPTVL